MCVGDRGGKRGWGQRVVLSAVLRYGKNISKACVRVLVRPGEMGVWDGEGAALSRQVRGRERRGDVRLETGCTTLGASRVCVCVCVCDGL